MIVDKCRSKRELKKLYNGCDNRCLPHLKDILALPTYRCFYDEKDGSLVGCIYLEDEKGKVMLCGFGRRKSYAQIIEAVKFILNLNPDIDIYSRTKRLSAKIVLTKAGFERLDNVNDEGNLYIRKAVA